MDRDSDPNAKMYRIRNTFNRDLNGYFWWQPGGAGAGGWCGAVGGGLHHSRHPRLPPQVQDPARLVPGRDGADRPTVIIGYPLSHVTHLRRFHGFSYDFGLHSQRSNGNVPYIRCSYKVILSDVICSCPDSSFVFFRGLVLVLRVLNGASCRR